MDGARILDPGGSPPSAPVSAPEPTAGPLPDLGRGRPIASVEIIGQPVKDSGPLDALHLAEVITYRDGSKPDIVGYDPEGRGMINGGDRLFAETSLGSATVEQYIAAGRERYRLSIEPTATQSLEQFVSRQSETWKRYDSSPVVPNYDAAGNDVALHNSNSAMVASITQAGRADVAAQLRHDLEPPSQMREREQKGLSAESAGMTIAIERLAKGLPHAPGTSNRLSASQVDGTATPTPDAVRGSVLNRELGAAARAVGFEMANIPTAALHHFVETHDLLSSTEARGDRRFPVMLTSRDGSQSTRQMDEPFRMEGKILSADTERVTQSIGRGQTYTYRTEDLLRDPETRPARLRTLENAAANGDSLFMRVGINGAELARNAHEFGQGYERGR